MIEKQIKISCVNTILKQKPVKEGYPWRSWRVQVHSTQTGNYSPLGSYIDHIEFILHDSFKTPRIVCYKEPFIVRQNGWGAFDLRIVFHFKDINTPPQTVMFDLNFEKPKYSEYSTLILSIQEPSFKYAYKKQNSPTRKRKQSTSSVESNFSSYNEDNKSQRKSARTKSESSESPSSVTTSSTLASHSPDNVFFHFDEVKEQSFYNCRSPHQTKITSCYKFSRKEDRVVAWNDALPKVAALKEYDANKTTTSRIDIKKLGNSLEALDDCNLRKMYMILLQYDRRNMRIVETEDQVTIDLYSLGNLLLKDLWDFTRKIESQNIYQ